MRTIVDYVDEQGIALAGRPFLTEEGRTYSFAELRSMVRKMAAFLRSNGVGVGDRVILNMEGRTAHLVTYFGSMALGAIPVHLHTLRPRQFVEFAVADTGARLMITRRHAEHWEGFPCPIVPFPDLDAGLPEYWSDERSDTAHLMYTSGTTGTPKAVMTSQESTIFTARTIIDFAELTAFERELICLPLAFTFGLGHVHSQLMLGGQAHLSSAMRDRDTLLGILADDRITGFLASPGMLKSLTDDDPEAFAESASGLGYMVINCTPMPVPLTSRLLDLLPATRIYMYYGLTEASRSAYICYNRNPDRLACTGRATDGVSLRIDRPNDLGDGEVLIKGPNVMPGYWGDARPACIDDDGWLHTGDLASMDDGGYITVKGRIKEQISVDGMKCQPLEIETALNSHPDVVESAVVAIRDERTYQAVGAVVVTSSDEDRPTLAERLRSHCGALLEPFKVPSRIVFVDAVPKTDLGKIKRLDVERALTTATSVGAS